MRKRIMGIIAAMALALAMPLASYAEETDAAGENVESETTVEFAETVKDELVGYEENPIDVEKLLGIWEGEMTGDTDEKPVLKVQIDFNRIENEKANGYLFIIDEKGNRVNMFPIFADLMYSDRKLTIRESYNSPINDLIGIKSWGEWKGAAYLAKNVIVSEDSTIMTNEEGSPLIQLTKVSNERNDYTFDSNTLKTGWVGYYVGALGRGDSVEKEVKRNYRFKITKVNENGNLEGVAIFTPAPDEDASYGATGSYKFKGKVDFNTGLIEIQGYEWVNVPDKWTVSQWRFAELHGWVDNVHGKIWGHSAFGDWLMDYDITTPFIDVPFGSYYYYPVGWAVDKKVTTGKTDITFCPADKCTRAEVVTFLWRSLGCPEPKSSSVRFSDVANPRAYYYKAVNWAAENGITTGKSPSRFAPNDKVTRGEFVTFLYRAKGEPEVSGECSFGDVEKGMFYYNPVVWAAANKVTTGKKTGVFDPKGACTRGEVVTFIYRAYAEQ